MKKIPLTRGKFALVDDEDFNELSQHKWSANKSPRKYVDVWYAVRQYRHPTLLNKKGYSKQVSVIMHRVILGAPKGMHVDHIDGDGLNNQKVNLRICTQAQNLQNQNTYFKYKLGGPLTSIYKGVARCSGGKKWVVSIAANGVNHLLGSYSCEKAAAREYDKLAKLIHGEFANLNFPD